MDSNRSVLLGSICGAATFVLAAVAAVAWLDSGDTQPAESPVRQVELPDRTQPERMLPENTGDKEFVNKSPGQRVTSALHSRAPSPGLRRAAMQEIARLAEESWQQSELALVGAALSDADHAVREEAVHALGERDGIIALQTLQQALQDPNERVRHEALRALAGMSGDRSVEILGATLGAEDASMRLGALDALGQIGSPDATRYLRQALGDDSEDVRDAAAEWLGELTNTRM